MSCRRLRGPWGYEEFLEAIWNPNHEEHDDMLEWVGGTLTRGHLIRRTFPLTVRRGGGTSLSKRGNAALCHNLCGQITGPARPTYSSS